MTVKSTPTTESYTAGAAHQICLVKPSQAVNKAGRKTEVAVAQGVFSRGWNSSKLNSLLCLSLPHYKFTKRYLVSLGFVLRLQFKFTLPQEAVWCLVARVKETESYYPRLARVLSLIWNCLSRPARPSYVYSRGKLVICLHEVFV